MCSYSAPGCITISEATHALICDEYDTLHRGEKVVKGKGRMRLYFLLGRASEALRIASFDDDDDLTIVVRADDDVTA